MMVASIYTCSRCHWPIISKSYIPLQANYTGFGTFLHHIYSPKRLLHSVQNLLANDLNFCNLRQLFFDQMSRQQTLPLQEYLLIHWLAKVHLHSGKSNVIPRHLNANFLIMQLIILIKKMKYINVKNL
jgi:hypothetical protein